MTGAPGATRTASVTNGTWKVYQYGKEYTGVDIVIAGAPGDARFDLYTGSYTVNPQGAATGGTFSAVITGIGGDNYNIDFGTLPSSFYFKGDAVTFTATGEGAGSYTYAWSGTHGAAQINDTDEAFTIPSVSGTINLICTITGSMPTAPTITTTTLPNGTIGISYSQTLAATGTTPITWTIDSGTLPGGLTLTSSTGVISGIPTTEETATFTVKAGNGVLPDDSKLLSITIQKSTGIEGIDNLPSKSLKAWMHGETLHVSGLTSGQTWRVYNISGMLLYHDIAEGDEADVSLSVRGVYIVQSGSVTVKVAY
jgi:hypothetical protein